MPNDHDPSLRALAGAGQQLLQQLTAGWRRGGAGGGPPQVAGAGWAHRTGGPSATAAVAWARRASEPGPISVTTAVRRHHASSGSPPLASVTAAAPAPRPTRSPAASGTDSSPAAASASASFLTSPLASSSLAASPFPAASPASRPAPAPASPADTLKAEVGRATWTLLHSLGAQMPQRPSRQQQRDAATLVDCLTRIYPCGECAAHFAELVRRDPPAVRSGPEFRLWLCRAHNRVNARIGKPAFNCDLVDSRWAPLGCGAAEEGPAGGGAGGESAGAGCELLGVGRAGARPR